MKLIGILIRLACLVWGFLIVLEIVPLPPYRTIVLLAIYAYGASHEHDWTKK